jgi:putative endonuclease
MIFYVYVLQSLTSGTFYTGYTSDLEKRIERHNNSMNIYTKNRGPWKLVHNEVYFSRSEAMKREKFLKTGKGRVQIRNLIQK